MSDIFSARQDAFRASMVGNGSVAGVSPSRLPMSQVADEHDDHDDGMTHSCGGCSSGEPCSSCGNSSSRLNADGALATTAIAPQMTGGAPKPRGNGDCRQCQADQKCEGCGEALDDEAHLRAQWAQLVASSKVGQTAFWKVAALADAFFQPDVDGSAAQESNIGRSIGLLHAAVSSQGTRFDQYDINSIRMNFGLPVVVAEELPGVFADSLDEHKPNESAVFVFTNSKGKQALCQCNVYYVDTRVGEDSSIACYAAVKIGDPVGLSALGIVQDKLHFRIDVNWARYNETFVYWKRDKYYECIPFGPTANPELCPERMFIGGEVGSSLKERKKIDEGTFSFYRDIYIHFADADANREQIVREMERFYTDAEDGIPGPCPTKSATGSLPGAFPSLGDGGDRLPLPPIPPPPRITTMPEWIYRARQQRGFR